MKQNHPPDRPNLLLWNLLLGAEVITASLAIQQTVATIQEMGVIYSLRSGWTVLFLVYIFSGLFACATFFLLFRWQSHFTRFIEYLEHPDKFFRLVVGLVAIVAYSVIGIAVSQSYLGSLIEGFWMRLALCWWVIGFGMFAIKEVGHGITWPKALLASVTIVLVEFQMLSFLPQINNYPYSLSWSESSYIYYASLVASQRLYHLQLHMSIIYPSRALLDSIPFLLGDLPIWVHRLWGVFLWIGITATTSLLLASRLKMSDWLIRLSFAGWVFTYLLQGGVKYELQVCVIIILAGVSVRRSWLSLTSIVLASFWAGMSRLNWYPVPGILAAALYLLEEPISEYRTIFHYLKKPAAWFILGMGAALLGSAFTLHITNSDWKALFSFGTTPSFWYRLFPSATYSLGVLPGIALFSLPLWCSIAIAFRTSISGRHLIQVLGMIAITLVLFAGGLYVSTKIGGGGDLHNLDAYTVCLIIWGSYLAFQRAKMDFHAQDRRNLPGAVIATALAIQLGFVIPSVRPINRYDYQTANQNLQLIESRVAPAAKRGEVLFISQRQLLTFQSIEGIALVPDYELVELSAMVNTGNQPYLDMFHNDLMNHRFSMIVTYTLVDVMRGEKYSFGEENDIWIVNVVRPLLCDYEPVVTLPDIDVQLLVPRQESDCLIAP